jgi:cytochrome c
LPSQYPVSSRRRVARRRHVPLCIAVTLGLACWGAEGGAAQDVDLAKARQQFLNSCGVCHTAEKGGANRQGPNLHDIVGKAAAERPDFKFSEPLKSSGLVWDEATLDRWIEDAQAMRPGTIMAYRQRDPERRQLIIAYLKSLSEPK